MRALSLEEIEMLVAALRTLVGTRLQEVKVGKTGVGLGFWTGVGGLAWLWFEDHVWRPMLLPLNRLPEGEIKPARPLALFVRAHHVGARLAAVERVPALGRAIRLEFDESGSIEVRLWPHGANIIARSGERKVAFKRIADVSGEGSVAREIDSPSRTLAALLSEWSDLRDRRQDRGPAPKAGAKRGVDAARAHAQEIKRIEKALGKVQADIAVKRDSLWREAGEWLVENQSLAVPARLAPFVDGQRSLAWNVERCFAQAKEVERKLAASATRLAALEADLARVRSIDPEVFAPKARERARQAARGTPGQRSEAGARYRSIALSGGLVAKVGRSAADNLMLLRSARGWDLWLHLRDFPGAHAIVNRERQQRVSDEDLRQAGIALVRQSIGAKADRRAGERFEMIIAECRHVRPIRGDRLGRVTYRDERTMVIKLPTEG